MVPKNDDKTQETESSRPPTLKDLLDLCRNLNEKKANYVIIGGMAMLHHGFIRATEDIDLLIETTPENEKKIKDVLIKLPDHAAQELEIGDVDQYIVVRVVDEIVVDLMKEACGKSFSDAKSKIEWTEIQGVKIPFASPELLIELKQSIREKDKLDLMFLKELVKNKKD